MITVRVYADWGNECVPDLLEREDGLPIPRKIFDRYIQARNEFDLALTELEIAIADASR